MRCLRGTKGSHAIVVFASVIVQSRLADPSWVASATRGGAERVRRDRGRVFADRWSLDLLQHLERPPGSADWLEAVYAWASTFLIEANIADRKSKKTPRDRSTGILELFHPGPVILSRVAFSRSQRTRRTHLRVLQPPAPRPAAPNIFRMSLEDKLALDGLA